MGYKWIIAEFIHFMKTSEAQPIMCRCLLPRRVLDSLVQVGNIWAGVVSEVTLRVHYVEQENPNLFRKWPFQHELFWKEGRFFIDLGCFFVALARAAWCKTSCTGIRPAGAAALLVRRFGMVFQNRLSCELLS